VAYYSYTRLYRCIDFLLLQNNRLRHTHTAEIEIEHREKERVLDVENSWPSSRYIIAYHQKQSISNLRLAFSSNDERVLKKRLDVCNYVYNVSDSCALCTVCAVDDRPLMSPSSNTTTFETYIKVTTCVILFSGPFFGFALRRRDVFFFFFIKLKKIF
jgi:hypothetical protein